MRGPQLSLEAAFAAAMTGFGPVERTPRLAVAVSGGPDSLALMLLADTWARARGGRVLALTVDHGLRPEAAAEAQQVAAWARARGIDHQILTAARPPDATGSGGLQAAARALRYRLLTDACTAAGILHLLTGHHQEDQAETLLLRLQRGSGLSGLAGIAACQSLSDLRLLRPLLAVPKQALEDFCAGQGLAPIRDPSNHSPAFARVHWRALLAGTEAPFLAARLAETAARLNSARAVVDGLADAWLLRWVTPLPWGLARLPKAALADGAEEVRWRALARLCAWAGGTAYPPRFEGLQGLLARLQADDRPRDAITLGGTLWVRTGPSIWVGREHAALSSPLALPAGALSARWDGRFSATAPEEGWFLGGLGAAESARLRRSPALKRPQTWGAAMLAQTPAALLAGIPAFQRLDCPAFVPHLSKMPGLSPRLFATPLRPLVAGGERGS
ncbi:MAG: tRNA lysidine(34) synthetase TilS [Elstera sp.]